MYYLGETHVYLHTIYVGPTLLGGARLVGPTYCLGETHVDSYTIWWNALNGTYGIIKCLII